ncbi:MAG TPA: DUF4097 family beta strand repeat-containing protein [Candidatus Acidoferrales bacterium]|nr:DUF4097 family beta strand repeat-containing protein [Candidatus Acidoferrales bacterium]
MRSASPSPAGRYVFFLSPRLRSFLLVGATLLLAISGVMLCTSAVERSRAKLSNSVASPSRLTAQLAGSIPTHDGQRLHLVSELGNVIIHTQDSGKVDYHVRLEADASQKNARQLLKDFNISARETPDGVHLKGHAPSVSTGRLWVTLEVNVPRNYSLDVSTGGGNIETDDINGRVVLSSAGGSIMIGNIDGSAHLETGGGHITVKNVSGELVANTGGGHITTGSIGGNASLHTSGGHIRVASVGGTAHLVTGGGNVSLEHSGGALVAETAGGQIEVGEAAGLVRARTGGGGIHVVRVSGPTDLQTVGGSIYLTHVDSAVKATAAAGGITAWFVVPVKQPGNCDLQSNDGDIVVYLPRHLPVTIDAQIQMADEHRFIVDPAFPLQVSYADSSDGSRTVRAVGSLNGGGELLQLHAVAGNIRVVLSDASKQMYIYNQQMEQLQQQIQSQLHRVEQLQHAGGDLFEP